MARSSHFMRMDDREPRSIRQSLVDKYGIDIHFERLNVGDYLFSDICIERKTTSDFLSSVQNGRLWEQLKGIKENYTRGYLLLEGGLPVGYNKYSATDEMKAIGGLMGVSLGWNIPIIPSMNIEQTSKILNAAFHKASKEKTEYLKPVAKKHFTDEEVKEDVLCAIPGIGRQTARDILLHYPNIYDIQNATDIELRNVSKRLGLKTMEWLRRVFGYGKL